MTLITWTSRWLCLAYRVFLCFILYISTFSLLASDFSIVFSSTPLITSTDCEAYSPSWFTNYGGTNSEVARSIAETPDGGTIILGHSLSDDGEVGDNFGGVDFWLVKTDANGALEWERNYGGSSTDNGKSILTTSDGGYLICGETFSNDGEVGGTAGSFDFWVLKVDAFGNIQWNRLYGGSSAENLEKVESTPDGGYILVGTTSSANGDINTNQGLSDGWILKIDNMGTVEWSRTLGGSLEDALSFVQNTNDGGYIVAGNSFSSDGIIGTNNGSLDAIVYKLDALGNIQWGRNFGGSDLDYALCVRQTVDGGYIVSGVSNSSDGDFLTNKGASDTFVIKLNADGSTDWIKTYGGTAEDEGSNILCYPDGTYIMVANTFSFDFDINRNNGLGDIWMVRLQNDGTIATEDNFGGSMTEFIYDARFAPDGSILLCGFSESNNGNLPGNNGQGDFWAARFGVPTDVPPSIQLRTDTLICRGDMLELKALDSNCNNCTYLWNDGNTASTRMVTPNTSTNYTVTITNTNTGCTASDEVLIDVSNLAILITDVRSPSPCQVEDGFITLMGIGGTTNYTYQWDSGQSQSAIANLSGGEYTITINDGQCVATETITLNPSEGVNPAIDLGIDQSICAGSAVTLDAGTLEDTYLWNTSATSPTIEVNTPGTYSVLVTTPEGCIGRDTVIVTEADGLTVELGEDIRTCGEMVSLDAALVNMNYAWSDGVTTTQSLNTSSGGIYSVTVTNSSGCTGTDAIEVIVGTTPTFEFGENQSSCEAIQLNAPINDVTYTWSTGNQSSTIEVNATDWYTLIVKNDDNCTYEDSIFIEIFESPTLDLGLDQTACDSYVISSSTSADNYLWSTGETLSGITINTTDWYKLTITDENACTAQDSVFITINESPVFTLGDDISSCVETNLEVALSDVNYLWSTGATTSSIETTGSDTYSVTVTTSSNCSSVDAIDVTIVDNLSINLGEDITSCTEVEVSAGIENLNYNWTDLTNNTPLQETSSTLTVATSGMYALTATDNSGCSATDSIEVNIANALTIELGETIIACEEAIINPNLTNVNYQWSTGATTPSILLDNSDLVSLVITDEFGCTAEDNIEVIISNDLQLNLETLNISCFDLADASATVFADGGYGSYTYLWSTNETDTNITELTAGEYSVSIMDEAGCEQIQDFTIEAPEVLSTIASLTHIGCSNEEGLINLTTSGGTGAYTYLWSDETVEPNLTTTTPNMYTVTITDNNNCTIEETFEITATDGISLLDSTIENPNCADETNGTINIEAIGGEGMLSYMWTNLSDIMPLSSATNQITGLNEGVYQVVIQDEGDCISTFDFVLEAPPALNLEIQSTGGCGEQAGSAFVSVSGGIGSYTYLWDNGESTTEIENLASGDYSVTITDENACTENATTTITNVPMVAFESIITPVSCADEEDGTIEILPINGSAPFSIEWSTGQSSDILDQLDAGVYTVFVSDANDCLTIETIELQEPDPLAIQFTTTSSPSGAIQIEATPTGGTAPYLYLWNTGATTNSIMGNEAIVYDLLVTDANGCTYKAEYEVNTTSTNTLSDLNSFLLFPNPSQGQFMISLKWEKQMEGKLFIRNVLGQILEERLLDEKEAFLTFDLRAAVSGIYFVEIQTEKGMYTHKFSIN